MTVANPSEGEIELVVSDEGSGFDPLEPKREAPAAIGFGLLSIRERVQLLGGRFVIDAAPGRGRA